MESFVVNPMIDHVDLRAFDLELSFNLPLRVLRDSDDAVVGRLYCSLRELYGRSNRIAEFQGSDALVNMMNHRDNWQACDEARPPGDSMGNVIHYNVRILR